MSYRVLKFGGSSLASPDRLDRVVELVRTERREGPVALVVSAMGPSTDWLVTALDAAARGDRPGAMRAVAAFAALPRRLALPEAVAAEVEAEVAALQEQLHGVWLLGEASPRVRDRVLSAGERVSSRVVAARLEAAGVEALAVDARDWLVTDDRHGEARVHRRRSTARLTELSRRWNGHVPVVTGFIGRSEGGDTTTLGRNGSDYTASLLAADLSAEELQIWSDVPGVMTADPALVPEARPLTALSYDEALELAIYGAKVLHPRTMIPLRARRIPLRIRNTLDPSHPGTRIDPVGDDDEARATSVTSLADVALLDLQLGALDPSHTVGERLHRALQATGEPVWLVTHAAHGQAMSVVVPRRRVRAVRQAVEAALRPELQRGELKPIGVRTDVAMITLVAEAMGRRPHVAGRLFSALGEVGIAVRAIGQSASARSISAVVDEADLPLAVRRVHTAFHLTHARVSLLVLGKGTVGSALLDQVASQAPALRADHDVEPVVVGLADRARVAFDPDGLDLSAWPRALAEAPVREGPWGPVDEALLDRLAVLPTPVLVDCTASGGLEPLYEAAFARGIHVVSANKRPLAGPPATVASVRRAARRAHRSWRYETTVGAALPVLDTLQHLVRTGDRVRRVEGALSGTLGFLCDALNRGVPLGEAVRAARAAGLTEPRPQEDLSGVDAARKALILARELGMEATLQDVQVTPLVPADLLGIETVPAFLDALDAAGPALAEALGVDPSSDTVIRYLATVDPLEERLEVGPVAVGPHHPAARLRGPTAMVAFTTDRYATDPLVVQGPGAGGEVTAAGVLADVLRLAVR